MSTSGSYSQSFDLTLTSTYNAGFLTANGGTAAGARTALIAGLLGGQAYANIHDQPFPGGEIRGQLALVPEPASWAMLIGGFAFVGTALRQRRGRFGIALEGRR